MRKRVLANEHPENSAERPGAGAAKKTGQATLGTLGDFDVRREIGRGGMGTVYEAWQRSLGRVVALKVLSGRVSATPKSVLRFQREAQAGARVNAASALRGGAAVARRRGRRSHRR